MSGLNETPRAERLHIGFYGRRNSGKSSLINAFAGHQVALVSDVAGTTADPVYKSMEIHGLGPCVLIDTAGYDDVGELGALRVEKTVEALRKTDAAVLLFSAEYSPDDPFEQELEWLARLREGGVPVLAVISKADLKADVSALRAAIKAKCALEAESLSSLQAGAAEKLRMALLRLLPEGAGERAIAAHMIKPGDTVLLVMPQDIQAPKGRLILPQVQTTRDLLDGGAVVISVTADRLEAALAALKAPPALIITDSQVFPLVFAKKPPESRLTSFSILLAAYKGDIDALVRGAEAVDGLTESSRVLIAEACTHAPLSEDIGRVKIPRLLRKRIGDGLQIDMVSGTDFPRDLSGYDLVVHCGACMFNRRYLLGRIDSAREAGVPMTNYGVLLAKLSGILDKVEY